MGPLDTKNMINFAVIFGPSFYLNCHVCIHIHHMTGLYEHTMICVYIFIYIIQVYDIYLCIQLIFVSNPIPSMYDHTNQILM